MKIRNSSSISPSYVLVSNLARHNIKPITKKKSLVQHYTCMGILTK